MAHFLENMCKLFLGKEFIYDVREIKLRILLLILQGELCLPGINSKKYKKDLFEEMGPVKN